MGRIPRLSSAASIRRRGRAYPSRIPGQQAGSPPESRPTVLRGFGAAGQGLAEVQHQFHPSPLLRFPLPGQLIAKSIPLTNERLEEPAGFLLHTIKLLAACFAPFRFEMEFLFESDPLAQHRMQIHRRLDGPGLVDRRSLKVAPLLGLEQPLPERRQHVLNLAARVAGD